MRTFESRSPIAESPHLYQSFSQKRRYLHVHCHSLIPRPIYPANFPVYGPKHNLVHHTNVSQSCQRHSVWLLELCTLSVENMARIYSPRPFSSRGKFHTSKPYTLSHHFHKTILARLSPQTHRRRFTYGYLARCCNSGILSPYAPLAPPSLKAVSMRLSIPEAHSCMARERLPRLCTALRPAASPLLATNFVYPLCCLCHFSRS
ncbi:hypothetical protein K402DRAFT_396635 [Aulographum hederae CBS 113979]|uniref:Uncharacterized protein n=1 Tax=Aulographum hederae CBS 113979 TaxID=1176131 RepID=A0A6G1GQZ9_9PEZI|nr:hypothetical protein K402DRAFT_396635 [Aulographum hederae CBS 113979]